jgi:hypothetical protein
MTQDADLTEVAAELDERLRQLTWQLQGMTRNLRKAVALSRENNAALADVVDQFERLFPPERPALQLVKGDDDG